MPRTNTSTSATMRLIFGAVVRIVAAIVTLWLAAQIEARMIRQENTPSVCEPSPLERAVMPLAEAWREENRIKR